MVGKALAWQLLTGETEDKHRWSVPAHAISAFAGIGDAFSESRTQLAIIISCGSWKPLPQ